MTTILKNFDHRHDDDAEVEFLKDNTMNLTTYIWILRRVWMMWDYYYSRQWRRENESWRRRKGVLLKNTPHAQSHVISIISPKKKNCTTTTTTTAQTLLSFKELCEWVWFSPRYSVRSVILKLKENGTSWWRRDIVCWPDDDDNTNSNYS